MVRRPATPEPARDDPGDIRYTLMVVPEGGRGTVWQRSIRLRTVRRTLTAAASVVAVLAVLAILQIATLPRVLGHDALVGENLALRARLDSMEKNLATLEPMIQRVRAYDDQLREMSNRPGLPGFGPLDTEEADARQRWLDGVLPDLPTNGTTTPPHADVTVRAAAAAGQMADLATAVEEITPHADAFEETLARWQTMQDVLPQLWPADGVLTSPFGWRKSPWGPGWRFHGGIDIGLPYAAPILGTNDGLVTFSGWDSGHGYMVELDHGHGVASRYCHASQLLVAAGDTVTAGDVIALAGSTGQSTGTHLHYELFFDGEKVDPLAYLP